ncbi:MAG: polysaccharide biosynthesis protein [Clostridia bacterium]|nr:polysaccharide biosynthesis protein [Clostridia bacterium]
MLKSKKEQKQQSFMYATLIMAVSTIIVKILGLVFRIPITNLLGTVNMGYYSTAYEVYLPIYSIAMAGLPVAVSRMVAQYVSENRYNDVKSVFKVAKRFFVVTGLVGFILMFGIGYIVTVVTKNPEALPSMFVIAPCLIFCCILSLYRGYYEGLRNMFPTAISSLIEAICKLVLGYGFAWMVMSFYDGANKGAYAAAAAILGITVGTAIAAFYVFIRHKTIGDSISDVMYETAPNGVDTKEVLKALVAISIPVVLGSMATQISGLIDVTMVQYQLNADVAENLNYFKSQYGYYLSAENVADSKIHTFLYSTYRNYAYTFFNLVPTITAAVGVSALPVLTMAWTNNDKAAVKSNLESMLKVITLIAFPAGLGLIALAPQILGMLYKSASVEVAAPLLRVLGIAACFAGMTTPMTNLLQAIGKPTIPVKNIAVGAVIKVVVNYILVGIPSINIMGAPIGTVCCYLYIAIADLFCIVKYSRVVPSIFITIIKPLAAAAVCAVAAYFSQMGLSILLDGSRLATIGALVVAVFAYIIAVSLLKCITREDIASLPKGEKLADICAKLHIIH